MPLSSRQIKYLRHLGHRLKPCIMVGQAGVTRGLLSEAEHRLGDHELIKVKIRVSDRAARRECLDEILVATQAQLIQSIGHMALIYRPHPDGNLIKLPD